MADPTALVSANQNYVVDETRLDFTIKNAEALVQYGLGALDVSTGKLEFAEVADNLLSAGLILGAADGDNASHLTGSTTAGYKAMTRGGLILGGGRYGGVSVTGASAITDLGKPVWATDGQTLTLTRQAAPPVGIVVGWVSSTYCHVYLFSFIESWIISQFASAPSSYFVMDLGSYPTNAIQGTSAASLKVFPAATEHYKILSWHAQPTAFDNAVVAGAQVLNLEIGGTTVKTTGGVNPSALTLGYASFDATGDMGTAIDASTVVSANEVHIGDVLEVVLTASGTGFTADAAAGVNIYAVCQRLPGV